MTQHFDASAALKNAIEREQRLYGRRIAAYRRVKQAFIEAGNGAEMNRRLRAAQRIYEQWKSAYADLLKALDYVEAVSTAAAGRKIALDN